MNIKYNKRKLLSQKGTPICVARCLTQSRLCAKSSSEMEIIMRQKKFPKIIYRNPAEGWYEGLPIGNGRIGAMTECGVNEDHMFLNEESIWEGYPGECVRKNADIAIRKLQKRLFAGENKGAEKLVIDEIMPKKQWFGSYQPFGELRIRFKRPIEYKGYKRWLDLEDGVVYAQFACCQSKALYKKEYFASRDYEVIAIHYTCSSKSSISLEISLTREENYITKVIGENELLLTGQCSRDGVCFAGAVAITSKGGSIGTSYVRQSFGAAIQVDNADSVTVYVSMQTNMKFKDYEARCIEEVRGAAAAGYEAVRTKHLEQYRALFTVFEIGLGKTKDGQLKNQESSQNGLSVIDWLSKAKQGEGDEGFFAMLVQYYRYLLISSSQPGCLPSNLQGIWNAQLHAPWESDYHTNINLQINYWPCDSYNLGECAQPLFEWLKIVQRSGEKTARDYYNARGFVLHHASNLFGHTAPCATEAGLWPMGGAWLVRQLYEHYLYTGDLTFLKEKAYPLMKSAAMFILDFLQEVPSGNIGEGMLVTNPSYSPENQFKMDNGSTAYFTYGAAMDFEIIRDLFGNCLKSIEIIGEKEAGFDNKFKEALVRTEACMPKLKVSKRTGGIQEWLVDYEETEIGHRHLSHLYALYPARDITVKNTPKLASAAKVSLLRRLSGEYHGQGWSYGWMSAMWARLREGNRAYEALFSILREELLCHNLFVNAHGKPQAGDGQAIPAAILEMLVQLEDNKLVLLPALPDAWSEGFVKGLCTIGGYRLNMVWKNGAVTKLCVDTTNAFGDFLITFEGEEKFLRQDTGNGYCMLPMYSK